METWPGVGERIAMLLREKGYWNPKRDKPDVLRFSMDYRYIPQFVYKWLSDGVVPSRSNLDRLSKDLGASAPWILFGDEVPKALPNPRKRGGRKLVCLVVALLTMGGGRAAADPRSVDDNAARYLLSEAGNLLKRFGRWYRNLPALAGCQANLHLSLPEPA